MAYAEDGVRPHKDVTERELPDELVDALSADPELAEAFGRLTRGRRNSYAVNLAAARTAATRTVRIARFRGRILAGKGATER